MKLQFYKTEITFQGKFYKILTPVNPLTNIYVGISIDTPFVFANQADFVSLAGLFTLLTEMKDMIIYLPTRANQADYFKQAWFNDGKMFDMVVCHHSLQLKRGLFKELKSRLSKGNLASFKVDMMKFADLEFDEKFWHKENKDLLDVVHQQTTLFMTGSTKIFKQLARECLKFRSDLAGPPYHNHTHLDTYLRHGSSPHFEDMQLCFYDKIWWDKWYDEQEEKEEC